MDVEVVGTPRAVPGWDGALADRDTFYASRDWLEFADSDGEASGCYGVVGDPAAPVAVLPAHLGRTDTNVRYQPGRELCALARCGHRLSILGGRRGYRSCPVPTADVLSRLTEAVASGFDQPTEGWWWPYLLDDEVPAVVSAAPKDRMPAVGLLNADCVLDVPGNGLDDYLDALPNKRRRYNVRQEMKTFAASGLTVRRLRLSACWEQGGRLAANVQRRYGHDHSPQLMADVLRRQAERLDDRSVVFGCFDGSRMVGFSLAYRWRSELVIRLVGFDYDRLPGAFEYPQLVFYSPLQLCYEEGLTGIHLGTAGLGAKVLRGGRLRALWAVAHCPCTGDPHEVTAVLNGRLDGLTRQLPGSEAQTFARRIEGLAETFATAAPSPDPRE